MAVDLRFAESNRNLVTTATLVSKRAFESRNGGLSNEYREGRAAFAGGPPGVSMAERFLAYAESLVPRNDWGDPESLAHRLSGALSRLSTTDLADLSNRLEERAAAIEERVAEELADAPTERQSITATRGLLGLIHDAPALRCLPAPLLATAFPSDPGGGAFNYSVQFGSHIAGVARLNDGSRRDLDDGVANVAVVAVGEYDGSFRPNNEKFLSDATYFGRDARTPVSFVLTNAARWNEGRMGPIRDFLIAQRSLGAGADQLVAAVPEYLRPSQGFIEEIRSRVDDNRQLPAYTALDVAYEYGPAALSMALSLQPDALASKAHQGVPRNRAVLRAFGKPVVGYEYPQQVAANTTATLERLRQEAEQPAVVRRHVDHRYAPTGTRQQGGGPPK